MFCKDPLSAYPIYTSFTQDVGVVKFIIALSYFTMMLVTMFWLRKQQRNAEKGDSKAVHSVLFPFYTQLLWLSAISNMYLGLLMLLIPVEITGDNSGMSNLLYPSAWAVQHFVVEGIAVMLMQKGCGRGSAVKAARVTIIWAGITFVLQIMAYTTAGITSITAQCIWSSMLLIFYFCLWKLPQNRLFRRPAAIFYARFWFWFRVVTLTCYGLAESRTEVLSAIGSCGYAFGPLLGFTILQPYVCYWTLLEDCW